MNSENTLTYPCYHCGLDSDPVFRSPINGEAREFCCIGCQAVATAISEGGLSDFYKFRDNQNERPDGVHERFEAYDLPEVQASFVHSLSENNANQKRVRLLIGGISCAACAWLIENYLAKLPGIDQVRVNVATHQCLFFWDPDEINLSRVFSALSEIGYRPQPGTEAENQKLRKSERRTALLRMGLAGLGMMQVGMVSVALHAGAIQGIEGNWQHFLRWVSLIFAIPIMFYSAQPFFISAWRTLKMRHLNMDVPVSLALFLAFFASVYGTVYNTGEVYFDSVAMFTFFLLVGRFLEMQARHTSVYETERLSQLLPVSAERFFNKIDASENEGEKQDEKERGKELVPLSFLKSGDSIYIKAGDVIPCDGVLEQGVAMTDESLLTGESEPVKKQVGDALYAGALLAEPSVRMKVTATGDNTRLASVQSLLDQAIAHKPKQQQLADKVASYFVAAVLICFALVFSVWYVIDPSKAFWVALSVLVVTCPCALSLATPAALAAGLNKLRRIGLLVVSPSALETMPKLTHVALDKTGTLTYGEPVLKELQVLDGESREFYESCVAALEAYSRHPIALAFRNTQSSLSAEQVDVVPGRGIEGTIAGEHYRFGQADFALNEFDGQYPSSGNWLLLSRNGIAVAWFLFGDQAREALSENLAQMNQSIPHLSLFSGDRQQNVDDFIVEAGLEERFTDAQGGMLPAAKLAAVQALQAKGEKVLMVGDGINDVPVLAAADLSVAMGSASQLAKVNADAVLLNQNLKHLRLAIDVAKDVSRVIKQNLSWALGYNILALPAAAMGFIPPYLAALGMSLSSLIVVLNSLRVSRSQSD